MKARAVPFSLRPAVERELDRLLKEGIIQLVKFSRWATPLVCVPKVDGSVRLCGDYRSTVNRVIHTEKYPIPSVKEIRYSLSGGEKFTKLDLRCAYQQMLLNTNSQELCTVNTHKGLFRCTRLPYGVSSSPGIWQRFIEQVLVGVQGICVMMDDVCVHEGLRGVLWYGNFGERGTAYCRKSHGSTYGTPSMQCVRNYVHFLAWWQHSVHS